MGKYQKYLQIPLPQRHNADENRLNQITRSRTDSRPNQPHQRPLMVDQTQALKRGTCTRRHDGD